MGWDVVLEQPGQLLTPCWSCHDEAQAKKKALPLTTYWSWNLWECLAKEKFIITDILCDETWWASDCLTNERNMVFLTSCWPWYEKSQEYHMEKKDMQPHLPTVSHGMRTHGQINKITMPLTFYWSWDEAWLARPLCKERTVVSLTTCC